MLKKTGLVLFFTLLAFIILTWLTAVIRTPVDGNDYLGFPLRYYKEYSRMCDPCPASFTEINYTWLVVDILFAAVIGLLLYKFFRAIKAALTEQKTVPGQS